jgi:N-acetylmuramoyl-L-alanine amidase
MVAPLLAVLLAASPASRAPAPRAPREAVQPPSLGEARALVRAVRQDPARRRFRHEWERAIHALERAARGRDEAPALLEAARARYALYRFSSVEADREAALKLAARARRAGSREAAAFAAAVRREAGDDPAPRRPRPPAPGTAAAPARPAPAASAPPARPSPGPRAHAATPPPGKAAGAPTAPAAPAKPPAATPPRHGPPDAFDEPPSTDPVLDRILARLAEGEPAPGDAAAGPPAPAPGPDAPPARDPAFERIVAQLAATPRRADEEDRRPIRRIVVDPGHGGHDTGAIGPRGVREKDVALAIARRLARRLRAAGFEVVLTRDGDRYLALEERAAIANERGGDLFVSIHANAHPRRDRRGVETYVLDVAHDRYARRLAARENGLEEDVEGADVRRVLADLDAKASAAPSRRLADRVQRELCERIRERFGDVRDLGVKSALFYVLLGARMPAVLVETSFLSNRAEERRLATPRFQDEVAAGLAAAIGEHAAHEARVAAR